MANTPQPGPIGFLDVTRSIMTVLHTPLLGPETVHISTASTNSRAGFNANKRGQTDRSVQSSIDKADVRKVGTSHGSTKLSINFDKSSPPWWEADRNSLGIYST